MAIPLLAPASGYFEHALRALLASGWSLKAIPPNSRLPGNKWLLLTLRTPIEERRVRLFIYAVGESHRNRPNERRVEITTTYQSGLPAASVAQDVVLGWDRGLEVFVGIDPRRLHAGGTTHNASSFVDEDALRDAQSFRGMIVRPREQRVLPGPPVEYHAYFQPRYLTEYLFEHAAIHAGSYLPGGPWGRLRFTPYTQALVGPDERAGDREMHLAQSRAPSASPRVHKSRVEQVERTGKPPRGMTPEELERILRRQAENGKIGERAALDREREILRRAGRADLAKDIEWVAETNVAAGFDIKSFFPDGTDRFVEVKSAQGTTMTFDLSGNEWNAAKRTGTHYVVVRVTRVRDPSPTFRELLDPVGMVGRGELIVVQGSRRLRVA
jgi:hypothetical protein